MTEPTPLVLVDGSSYLYRAFHALPPLTTSDGRPTGAVKGVINMLRRLEKDYPASVIAVVFDAKGKTFRDDLFAEYKSQRPPMPDELREQIEPIHAIIRAMGLPLLVEEGVEADDVIGTLAMQAAEQQSVVISTGDKDMAQLVNERITLVNTMTETVLNPEGVEEKFGIPPNRIIDFLALMGDKVDNIPGVPGVGEKTALALIQGLGGVDDIYSRLEQVAGLSVRGAKTLGEKLRKSEGDARLSYLLATIKTDVVMPLAASELKLVPPDKPELLRLFKKMEFKSWIKALQKEEGDVAEEAYSQSIKASKPAHYDIVLDKKLFESWLKKLGNAKAFAFDTETTGLDYMVSRIVGVSFAVDANEAAYVPFAHDYLDAPNQLGEEFVLGKLKPMLESESIGKYGQNLKYDKHLLETHGIYLRGIVDDTMLQSYVVNSTGSRHDMDSLAELYLDRQTIHFEDIAGKGSKQLTFNQIALEQAGPYAAEDAQVVVELRSALAAKLADVPTLNKVYSDIEIPLVSVLQKMERNGALIDIASLQQQSHDHAEKLAILEQQAHDMAGEPFNLNSPKQLQAILFDKLNIPVLKKTPKGQPSTAEPILQELALDYPLPEVIMQYRGLNKLKTTYTDKLPQQVCSITGRIHTSYHQAVTATGRLSSSDPNLQNIPIRTAEGRRVRQAFIAPPEHVVVAADYSQIELRIMAHLSEDEGLVNAFKAGEDIHRATASEVFSVPLEEVDSEHRRRAKAINFGLIYGMSAFGLGKQLGIGRHEAQDYIDRYFERYPGVLRYMNDTRELAAKQGYVETLFGRRLHLAEINSRNAMRRQAAERTAINAPMQGSAADIIKIAMINVHRWIESTNAPVRMIMQVHDELVFEVPAAEQQEITHAIVEMMSSAAALQVPLLVDAGFGASWDEAH